MSPLSASRVALRRVLVVLQIALVIATLFGPAPVAAAEDPSADPGGSSAPSAEPTPTPEATPEPDSDAAGADRHLTRRRLRSRPRHLTRRRLRAEPDTGRDADTFAEPTPADGHRANTSSLSFPVPALRTSQT